MVFGRLFGNRGGDDKAEGKRLFELGIKSAIEFRSNEALDYYAKSIEVSENPSPYINRANLLGKRFRHFEAVQDLLTAQKIDLMQGKQFQGVIDMELFRQIPLTANYDNGLREKLVADLKAQSSSYIAGRILCTSFKIPEIQWENCNFDMTMIEFHFFNDLDNIIKFDDINQYPEVKDFMDLYPVNYIEVKANNCPDPEAYELSESLLSRILCCYSLSDMVKIRREMLYEMNRMLLTRDFGDYFDTSFSKCKGVIKDAEKYLI